MRKLSTMLLNVLSRRRWEIVWVIALGALMIAIMALFPALGLARADDPDDPGPAPPPPPPAATVTVTSTPPISTVTYTQPPPNIPLGPYTGDRH